MLPWIILTIICLILGLANLIYNLISLYWINAVCDILTFSLQVYLFVVVWSYRFSDIC